MDNPYSVVPAPTNYAAPMIDLFGNNQKPQGQPGQPGQGQPQNGQPQQQPGQQFGQGLAALLQKLFGQGQQQSGAAMDQNGMQRGPITPTQTPDQPISNFNPNTTGSLY